MGGYASNSGAIFETNGDGDLGVWYGVYSAFRDGDGGIVPGTSTLIEKQFVKAGEISGNWFEGVRQLNFRTNQFVASTKFNDTPIVLGTNSPSQLPGNIGGFMLLLQKGTNDNRGTGSVKTDNRGSTLTLNVGTSFEKYQFIYPDGTLSTNIENDIQNGMFKPEPNRLYFSWDTGTLGGTRTRGYGSIDAWYSNGKYFCWPE